MEGSVSEPGAGSRRPAFSARHVLTTIESALLGPSPPSPTQRMELMHAIRSAIPSFQSLLSYPPPKASDRAQVESKQVRLPDSVAISLDDIDVQIALKLSDELNLNEIECVRLLVSTNQEWILLGREPMEIFHLAAGLWYTERRDLITSLYTLFRAVVLDQGLESDFVVDIQIHLENLLNGGLRQRLIALIKELSHADSTGFGGPNCEPHIIDSRGALVERKAVVHRERLSLGYCLVFSVLVVRTSPKDVKDIFSTLKDCAAEVDNGDGTIKLQITFALLFSLLITFLSDALSTVLDKVSILSGDSTFRHEFNDLVMATSNKPIVEGFLDVVRLGWTVHLILTQEQSNSREITKIEACLKLIFSNNVFQFLLTRILRSAAYQNDDEDIICIYTAYTHKLMMCFLSHPFGRDKVKELKEKTMHALSPYAISVSDNLRDETGPKAQELSGLNDQPFISLLELIADIYEKAPELLQGNDDLWSFVNFAGEDHTNIQTLVAFLRMLSSLAANEVGALKVYELLKGRTFRSIGWNTLFECLSIYEEKFKQSLQGAAAMLPDFQEGDAKAVVAYLNVLQKVVENGNAAEKKNWFPDIEPLFKLLSYENVPPSLKGALRDAISVFITVSPSAKETIWSFLEQYDLPVVVSPPIVNNTQQISTQIYDMRFELNEVEAKQERYPSTISFLNLINGLIAKETDRSDRGRRFVGIFRFVYDHAFGSLNQRAYADPCEKWKLAIACLQHFKMILSMYDIKDEDLVSMPQQSKAYSTPLDMQFPVLELLKDFMSGRTAFRNTMSILLLGVNALINDRTSQIHGQLLEKAVHLSLEILVLVLQKDLFLSDYWRPLFQPLDVILSQDNNQVVTVLEYVRYNFLPQIQQCSVKIMGILSSRMVGLVQLLLTMGVGRFLVEDYAACLEMRLEESLVTESKKDDTGVLIMQLLLDNIGCPAPNITHLLLKFDIDSVIEQTLLQPKFHYSCLRVILDSLDVMPRPEANALLFEFGFQLLYELCLDPLTGGPTIELLCSKKYQFFSKHLETFVAAPLPKRSNNQNLRISSLHQRAWLLKLLALEMHIADMSNPAHRETCTAIVNMAFARGNNDTYKLGTLNSMKSRALELLEVVQFKPPNTKVDYSEIFHNLKDELKVEDILKNASTIESGGVYYYSERGDRLIELSAFYDKLCQMCTKLQSNTSNEVDLGAVQASVEQLLRWAWKYNKNLEEQAAQHHMLIGWSQIIEVTVSRRMMLLEDRSQILFELLDSSLSGSASADCSLKLALVLTQVAMSCMAKLRDERFSFPGDKDSDNVTCLDVIMIKQLPNGACQSILLKLLLAILRNDSSELLRRRQYALLLCYFQYCNSILDPDVPADVLRLLLCDERDEDENVDLKKIDQEQADLARANFAILKKEAQGFLDVVIRDSVHGSEAGKAMAFYVLDALVCFDVDKFFLTQLQSRGFLRSCLLDMSNISYQDHGRSLDSLQQLCTREAKFALLLRISHNYEKIGAEILLSMGALEHLCSSKLGALNKGKVVRSFHPEVDKKRSLITPIFRLVTSLTTMIDLSDFFEVKNKIVREVISFLKSHQSIVDQILSLDIRNVDEDSLEQINLVVSILSKVWPYEETDEFGFVQELFGSMHLLFPMDILSSIPTKDLELQRRMELDMFHVMIGLSSYLYFLVRKKSFRLQVSIAADDSGKSRQIQPTLFLVVSLLLSATAALERTADEKSLLSGKIQDINELSRQEVDDIISSCKKQDSIMSSDHIRKRRYIAMVEMCHILGIKEHIIRVALQLAEQGCNILLIHFQDNQIDMGKITDWDTLCETLLPVLERLEQIKEDKLGHNLKVFLRSVVLLKEFTIRRMEP